MKYITLFIAMTLSITVSAQDRLNILASASMFADMAQNIIGDKHDVGLIVPVGGDPHLYEPTPGDAKKVAQADLILVNGLTFEGWITELIANSGTKATPVVLTDGIQPIASDQYTNSNDPHAWMNASNGLIYVKNIYNAIIRMDPLNATYYQDRYNNYRSQLLTLDKYIKENIQAIPESNRFLITSHDAFAYYGQAYGIQVEAILGTSTDADAQTSDLMRVNKIIQENSIPAIFVESTVNPKLIEQIARSQEIKIGGSLFADSLGKLGTSGDTYLKMLKYNTDTIVKALKQNRDTSDKSSSASTDSDSGAMSYLSYGILALALIGILAFFVRKL